MTIMTYPCRTRRYNSLVEWAPGLGRAIFQRIIVNTVGSRYIGLLYNTNLHVVYRADSKLAPSQLEMSLHSNAVPYWLAANLKSAHSISKTITKRWLTSELKIDTCTPTPSRASYGMLFIRGKNDRKISSVHYIKLVYILSLRVAGSIHQ